MPILENIKLHYMKRLTTLFLALTMATTLLAQGRKGVPQIPIYPELQEQGSFSMILVPDPQSYTKFAANQPLFDLQTALLDINVPSTLRPCPTPQPWHQ